MQRRPGRDADSARVADDPGTRREPERGAYRAPTRAAMPFEATQPNGFVPDDPTAA